MPSWFHEAKLKKIVQFMYDNTFDSQQLPNIMLLPKQEFFSKQELHSANEEFQVLGFGLGTTLEFLQRSSHNEITANGLMTAKIYGIMVYLEPTCKNTTMQMNTRIFTVFTHVKFMVMYVYVLFIQEKSLDRRTCTCIPFVMQTFTWIFQHAQT